MTVCYLPELHLLTFQKPGAGHKNSDYHGISIDRYSRELYVELRCLWYDDEKPTYVADELKNRYIE